jgi:hypothetical protein
MSMVGALISETNNVSQPLSQRELDILCGVLRLARNRDPAENVIPDALWRSLPELSLETFGGLLTAEISSQSGSRDELSGLVFGSNAEPLIQLRRNADSDAYNEFDQVVSYVKFMRRGGWFQDWVGMQVASFADRNEPLPAPIEVMSWLCHEMAEFEGRREKAMQLVSEHPRLFPTLNIATAKAPTMTPVEPAVPMPAAEEPKPIARKKASKVR